MVIIDDGITNATQFRVGNPTSIEYDYYFDFVDTDDGVTNTHGDKGFLSAISVSKAYDVVDLKIADAEFSDYMPVFAEFALQDLLNSPELIVGSINMSFGGPSYPFEDGDEIGALASRGILSVVSAGNGGTRSLLESPLFPAALPDVICVGSHDGAGNPSGFSQNGPGVDILADGEDMPAAGIDGTSFTAPRVVATVTHVQAIVHGPTDNVLNVAQMIDVLQQGGAGPRSRPDPADGRTRYFLHDHAGSLDYAWSGYGGTAAKALEYVASHADLVGGLGPSADAGRRHFQNSGAVEGRAITFDGLEYVASHADLIRALGPSDFAGADHFVRAGFREGRQVGFDALEYIASPTPT